MTPDSDATASSTGVATPASGPGTEQRFVSPDTKIDLTNCDREPIHIPGAVQPHGALLVLREPDLTILQASANAGDFLGVPVERLLGTRLADLVGATQAEAVLGPLRRGDSRAYDAITLSVGMGGGGQSFDGVVHRSDGAILLELERETGGSQLSYSDFYKIVRETMAHVEHAESIVDLAAAIAEQMRELTGF